MPSRAGTTDQVKHLTWLLAWSKLLHDGIEMHQGRNATNTATICTN